MTLIIITGDLAKHDHWDLAAFGIVGIAAWVIGQINEVSPRTSLCVSPDLSGSARSWCGLCFLPARGLPAPQ